MEVAQSAIDGRKRIAAHGSSKVPVRGEVLAEDKSYEPPPSQVQFQVQIIADYLESIQRK